MISLFSSHIGPRPRKEIADSDIRAEAKKNGFHNLLGGTLPWIGNTAVRRFSYLRVSTVKQCSTAGDRT